MKICLLVGCCVLTWYTVVAQQIAPFKGVDDKVRQNIIARVDLLERAIQKSDTALLSGYLSKEFRTANQRQQNAVPLAALMHFPKAHLIITDIAIENDQTNLTLDLSSFLTLIVTLDKDYQFKAITIRGDKKEDFREITPAFEAAKIILPFHLRDGFILVDGKVNDKKGKFMFDTGTPFSFILNGDYLGFDNSQLVTSGNAGSGQGVSLYNEDSLSGLQIADQYNKAGLKNILYSNFGFIAPAVGEDFLGFIGYEFFKNYEFSIDYRQQIISLYRLDQNGVSTAARTNMNRDTVAVLTFNTEEKLGANCCNNGWQKKIKGKFDTGNQGETALTAETKKDLESAHLLAVVNEGYNFGDVAKGTSNYSLKHVQCNGYKLALPLSRLKPGETDELYLGYSFLNQYVSVWNFKKKTITLLRN